jgi:hypothetical protein
VSAQAEDPRPRPLADAAQRLRRAPGRPRTRPAPAPIAPIAARLLDLAAAAAYVSLSPWTLRDLEGAGVLRRVRVPLPNGGEVRKLLFDRVDLDRLIAVWKDETAP